MTTKRERYIRNQETTKTRAIYKIFQSQKARFIERLNKREDTAKRLELKFNSDDLIDPFLDEIAPDVPEYLLTVLPTIMNEAAKETIKRYKDLLPEGYALSFDIETAPAAKYLADLEDLMLSQADGSILKTTRDELRRIMERGVEQGQSYGQIAKDIQAEDPWVFSKTRAELIAVNEIGRAYGWANHEPAIELQREGYVLEKYWTTSHDDKVRKRHKANEAAGWIPLSQQFPGTGDQFAPSTNEIRCRCTSTHRITGIDDGKQIHPIPKGMSAIDIKKKHFDFLGKKV